MKEKDNIPKKGYLTLKQKLANKGAYYKERLDYFESQYTGDERELKAVKNAGVNYDLFNNILNIRDLYYVCKPFGDEKDMELPAEMVNRDISSPKIKSMLGMESKRPMSLTVVATNPEATTRKEQEETSRLRDYVVSSITIPIRQRIEQQKMEQQKGANLSPEEVQQINASIEEELAAQTPKEVKKYMVSEHQDPSEVMTNHLLNYLHQKLDLKRKFNDAFKHGLLSAYGVGFVGIVNGEPEMKVIDRMRFRCPSPEKNEFIEDKPWATYLDFLHPSDIVKRFSLTDSEINDLYSDWNRYHSAEYEEDLFSMLDNPYRESHGLIPVLHASWKEPLKVGFLTYLDENGELQETRVTEDYKLDLDGGDISIEWEYINETHEGYKIKIEKPIYKDYGPVKGQHTDPDSIRDSKLQYYGVIYDNMNSTPTSLMDRLKIYQYYYNIVMFRLELLIASDKGKKLLMNIGAVPTSSGINVKQWKYFFESSSFAWYDTSEEGNTYQDANNVAKVIDLSLASDIQKYIEIAEYLRKQAGVSTGITDQVEGQIGPSDAVSNTRQALVQSSHILEVYHDLHNYFKRNVLQALIETAKVAYKDKPKKMLSYILDDMGIQMFELDYELLDANTLGLFVANSVKAEEAKETIRQLTHAALQNQKVELSDVISVIRQEGIVEAEQTLKAAENTRIEREDAAQKRDQEHQERMEDLRQKGEQEAHNREKELIILREEEKRKTVIAGNALLGASYNPDLDSDQDGTNDFFEIARLGIDEGVLAIKRDELNHKKYVENRKLDQEDKKLSLEEKKIKTFPKK